MHEEEDYDGDMAGDTDYTVSPPRQHEVLTPSEVAEMFRVDPKTVTRWARAGKLTFFKTLGGHRRYHGSEVRALLEAESVQITEP